MMLSTPIQIKHYRLLALKSALKMESIGLRHSRLGSLRKPTAIEMGLKPNAKIPEVIAALEVKIKELEVEMANG